MRRKYAVLVYVEYFYCKKLYRDTVCVIIYIYHEQVLGRDYQISQQMRPLDLAPLFEDVWTGSQVIRILSDDQIADSD